MTALEQRVIDGLLARFDAYSDLADLLDSELLIRKIDLPKHKSLADHLWCIVGARESYTTAIDQGAWAGFACSMRGFEADDFRVHLAQSAGAAREAIIHVERWTPERADLLVKLAEHEAMHEGQIIRHMYALEKALPDSWVWA